MTSDSGALAWPAWPRADERGLVRFVTPRSSRWQPLDVSRFDLSAQPDRCRAVAEAVFDALRGRDIRYALEEYHPSDALQSIRTPAEVLVSPREGTCLDLAALFCGLCLAYELLPVLVVVEGHAFALFCTTHGLRQWNGYDRPGRELFAGGPLTDPARLAELVDSGTYLAVECTGFARSELLGQYPDLPEARDRADGLLTFERALAAGREQIGRADRPLRFALDVATAHYEWRIEPHPVEALPGAYATDIFRLLAQAPTTLAGGLRVLDSERIVAERTRDFVGRDFIFQEIDRLLAKTDFPSGYILVRGEPGIGKTALMSMLVKTRGYVHHFNEAQANIHSTRTFLANVCSQLIIRYQLDHVVLPAEATTDGAFLSQLLQEAAEKSGGQPVVVVVDALDEAEDDGLALRANRLALPRTLPPGVFFVISSREKKNYRLDVDRREDVYLEDTSDENMADVRTYVVNQLRAHPELVPAHNEDEFVDVMTGKSLGNFMYLVYVLADIRAGKISVDTMDDVNNLPIGLRAYYEQHWATMRDQDQDRFERIYEPVLRILATVREPVELAKVEEWTQLPPTRILDVIRDWRQFLNETPSDTGEPLYRVYHTSFQDFLAVEGVGLRPYHEKIALTALAKIPNFLDPP
ncbi:ATP-binding protein [Actinoplanes sp. NPDC024001]|uniref:ATP-binding protein n=1 Tax=Actinoplanes sp. NPDC024001 TaxID=3154598 RepID=UPI0033E446B2